MAIPISWQNTSHIQERLYSTGFSNGSTDLTGNCPDTQAWSDQQARSLPPIPPKWQ